MDYQTFCVSTLPFGGTVSTAGSQDMGFETILQSPTLYAARMGLKGDVNHLHIDYVLRPQGPNADQRIACRMYSR